LAFLAPPSAVSSLQKSLAPASLPLSRLALVGNIDGYWDSFCDCPLPKGCPVCLQENVEFAQQNVSKFTQNE
jgi:hypothetical protein